MDNINIQVGDKASYTFLPPFNNRLSSRTLYDVTNITTLQRLVDTGKNPLQFIYIDNEMTEEDYTEDLNERMLIIELVLDTKTFYIPKDRFSTVAEDSVSYSKRLIGVNLSYIPVDEDLADVITDIGLLVQNRLGIKANVSDTVVSADVQMPSVDHTNRETTRSTLKVEHGNYMDMYLRVVEINSRLTEKLVALEEVYLKQLDK